MQTYSVTEGDSPETIALGWTGDPSRAVELVRANPEKPWHFVGSTPTFKELYIGETLKLPTTWGVGATAIEHTFKALDSTNGWRPGFLGQAAGSSSSSSIITPLLVGLTALAAGVGLAYLVTRPPKHR